MLTVVWKKMVVALMICNIFLLGFTPVVEARIISTQESIQVTQRDQVLEEINSVVLRSDVQEQMFAMGVNPADVQERLAVLSDEELNRLASSMQDMAAGGDSVLAVIGIVFVVLLILELVGVTNIFTRF